MNPEEKTMETNKLIESIELLATAIRYHADVIGFQADEDNPAGEDGKQQVTLEHAAQIPEMDEPLVKPLTFAQVKSRVNEFAKIAGKEKTLKLVKKYAGSHDLHELKESDYHLLYEEMS
jgi:hypothetical protein